MEITIDKDTGNIKLKLSGRTSKGGRTALTVSVDSEAALGYSKRLKEAAYLSNRLKKISTWPDDRKGKALAELGF